MSYIRIDEIGNGFVVEWQDDAAIPPDIQKEVYDHKVDATNFVDSFIANTMQAGKPII